MAKTGLDSNESKKKQMGLARFLGGMSGKAASALANRDKKIEEALNKAVASAGSTSKTRPRNGKNNGS
jgi:surface antigen